MKRVIWVLSLFCSVFMWSIPVVSQAQFVIDPPDPIDLSEPYAPEIVHIPSDTAITLQTGEKQKFTINAEKVTDLAKTTGINYIEFIPETIISQGAEVVVEPKKHGLGSDPLKKCGFFIELFGRCTELDHSITYSWDTPGLYQVTARVGFKFWHDDTDSTAVREVVWEVEVFSPESEAPPEPPNIRIKPATQNSEWVRIGGPFDWYQVRENHHLDIGEDMTFEVEATSKDGIFSITFEADEQRPSSKYQFEHSKTPYHTVNYSWRTPGRKEVTATVVTNAAAEKRITWTIEVRDPNPNLPKLPDLIVGVSRVNQDISTIAVLNLSGEHVEVPHTAPLAAGDSFQLEATVRNSGSKESRQTNLRFYRSSDSNISTSDTLLQGMGSVVRVLKIGEEIKITPPKHFTVPTVPGVYYYGACVDISNNESDVNNNCSNAIAITVRAAGPPDLVVQSISVNTSTVVPGEDFTLSATVENQGSGESSPTTLRYLKWDGTTRTWKRIPDKTSPVLPISANSSITKEITFTASNATGKHLYAACVDAVPRETNPDTNCSESWVTITVQQRTVAEDVNGDGIVNILDLVHVDSHFGETGENAADVNDDGIVDIADLLLVAKAISNAAGAPSAEMITLNTLNVEKIQQWLTEARVLEGSSAYQPGIGVLERLFTILTPEKTVLLPNYPNPFNPETWIPYQLAVSAEVRLTIYTVDGNVIRTFVLGHQTAGNYQNRERAAYWDGKNALGESVASGLYFYTLTAGDFTATRKMLIRK